MSDQGDQGELFRLPYTGETVSKGAIEIVTNALAQDEPVFVIRAKDFFAVPTLGYYVEQVERQGPRNAEFLEDIVKIQNAMRAWQSDNWGKVRYPD